MPSDWARGIEGVKGAGDKQKVGDKIPPSNAKCVSCAGAGKRPGRIVFCQLCASPPFRKGGALFEMKQWHTTEQPPCALTPCVPQQPPRSPKQRPPANKPRCDLQDCMEESLNLRRKTAWKRQHAAQPYGKGRLPRRTSCVLLRRASSFCFRFADAAALFSYFV